MPSDSAPVVNTVPLLVTVTALPLPPMPPSPPTVFGAGTGEPAVPP